MEVLMLRFDIFEKLHRDLYDFWDVMITPIIDNNALVFTSLFINYESTSHRVLPEMTALSESHFNQLGAIGVLEDAQVDILRVLGITESFYDFSAIKEQIKLLTSENSKILAREYFELEESKQLLQREIEKLNIVIRREMKKLWNRIDTLIIYSYKQMLFDVTGSDDLVQAFMNELRTVGIMKDLAIAKRKHDYKTIMDMIGALDSNTGEWISDIEQLVGAPQ